MKTPFGSSAEASSSRPKTPNPNKPSVLKNKWLWAIVAVVVVFALIGGFIFFKNSNNSSSNQAVQQGSGAISAGATGNEPPPLVTPGFGLALPISMDKVPAPSKEVVDQFGATDATTGIVFAISLAQATAADENIWTKMIEKKVAATDLTPADFSDFGHYMNNTGKIRWIGQTGDQRVIKQGPGPGDFLQLPPDNNPKIVWEWPYLRPSANNVADSFTVNSTTVGPDSKDGSGPTMVVNLDDYHVFDYKIDGKWTAWETHRNIVYTLAQTNNPDSPWLLEDWKVTDLPGRYMAAWVRD